MKILLLCALCASAAMLGDKMAHPALRKAMLQRHKSLEDAPFLTTTITALNDHNDLSKGTFAQRVAYNTSYWRPGGPVLLYLAGEGPLEFFLSEVQMLKWAKQLNGALVFIEHRFYGNSVPTGRLTTDALSLLTVDQALADAHDLRTKWTPPGVSGDVKWIINGCSYSGCLSGWYRKAYPDDVVGSYAPSGPVLAQADYTGYGYQWGQTAGDTCSKATTVAWKAVTAAAATDAGRAELTKAFNLCTPLQADDLTYFFHLTAIGLAGGAQGDLPPTWVVKTACQSLQDTTKSPLERFANAWFDVNGGGGCNDLTSAGFVNSNRNTTVAGAYYSGRSWWYQKCTEFGYFKTMKAGSSPFDDGVTYIDVDFLVGFCERIFDKQLAPDCDAINAKWGAKKLDATHVVITQGSLDPWHLLGITADEGDVHAVMYEAGHCAPLHDTTNDDPPSVINARKKVFAFFLKWLQ